MAKVGSGDWFKTIISLKKGSAKSNGLKGKKGKGRGKESARSANQKVLDADVEASAATQIQTAIRAYLARKHLRRLKGAVRLQNLTQNRSIKKQAGTTLSHLHSWCKVQAEIKARRQCMVAEGRLKQKKLENQLKLEAKLHDLQVEWSGGSDTMEETLARIHHREEAAVKRERTMAYAFSHQWRASSNQYLGLANYELGKENWGWSWKERWIAARPWERRVPINSNSPKKVEKHQADKGGKNTNSPTSTKKPVSLKPPLSNGKDKKTTSPATTKTPISSKSSSNSKDRNTNSPATSRTPGSSKSLSNGKGTAKPRRLSYPAAEKAAKRDESKEIKEAKGEDSWVTKEAKGDESMETKEAKGEESVS